MGKIDRQRVRQVFMEVAEAPAAGREAALKRACRGDALLRQEVEALLAAEANIGGFMGSPTAQAVDASGDVTVVAARREGPGSKIGPYRLLQLIGEGGFGAVYLAEQREPVKRRVALKIIKLGMDTRQVIARFEQERQALALMDHPNISRVFDAGATETGRPYFVMELVKGVPILEYCDTGKIDTGARLGLFVQVCNAIQHAHQKGIIHRDIKPSNVLVTLHDGVPVVKVIDFGIAKATNAELTEKTLFTQHRQMIGTPAYMAPEQAEMSGLDIDTRSDVYSLGVLLYELLTGTTPFDIKELAGAGYAEMMRIIREVEPHKPSTRLSTLGDAGTRTAQQRSTDLKKLGTILRGDLDWIVMKCLEKDRSRRYETANGLAADVQRHLSGEPVIAAPPSRSYRVRKFVRRNRAQVAVALVIAAVLVLGVMGTSAGMAWALREKDRAEHEARRALAAEIETKARAEELEQVAAFQASQLSDIEAEVMGIRLRRNIIGMRRAALEARGGMDEPAIAQALKELDSALAGVNFTNVALETLDENIFERALKAIERDFADQPLVKARLLQTVADTLHHLGLFDRAMSPQEAALAIRRRELGDEHEKTLISVNNMGVLLQDQGRFEEAESYHREALDTSRRVLGEENQNTLNFIAAMGVLLAEQGKYTEAEPYMRDALESSRRVLGNQHANTLNAIANLAGLLVAQGKFAEAESYHREALDTSRRVLGEEHKTTLMSNGHMGQLLRSQGKLAAAEPYLREALEGFRRLLGDEHPLTLSSVNNMGNLLLAQGKHAQAEPYFRDALEKYRRVLGEEHMLTLRSIQCVAESLKAQGRLAEAEPYCREALEKCRRSVGEDHPIALYSIDSMGRLLWAQGKRAEAEPYIREALERRRRVLGDEHPRTLSSINHMGSLLQAQGKLVEAEPYFREALERRRRVLGDEHPDTLNSINYMGYLLQAQGKLAEAEPYFREALERRRRVLGDEHPSTLTMIGNMGSLLKAQGKLVEAEPYFREALERRRRVLGDEHPSTLISINNMGYLLQAQGKLVEAEPYFREALERRRRVLGNEHADTLLSMDSMSSLLYDQGKAADAEVLYREALEIRRRIGTPNISGTMALFGLRLLKSGTADAATRAEPILRECLELRRAEFPDGHERVWLRHNTASLLGEALALQGRFAEAEPLLVESYNAMKDDPAVPPPEQNNGEDRVLQALERIVKLYNAWAAQDPGAGYEFKESKWRALLPVAEANP